MSQVMALAGSFPPNEGNITTEANELWKAVLIKPGALQRLSSVAYVWNWVRACCQDDFRINRAHSWEKTSRGLHLHPLSAKLLEKGPFLCVAKSGVNPDPAGFLKNDLLSHLLSSIWLFLSTVFWALRKENKTLFQLPSLCDSVKVYSHNFKCS